LVLPDLWHNYQGVFCRPFFLFLDKLFNSFTKSELPFIDAFTTSFSLLATYMTVKKVLENWLYWIVIDLTSVFLYHERDLHLTAFLFIIYTVIATFAYFNWKSKSSNA